MTRDAGSRQAGPRQSWRPTWSERYLPRISLWASLLALIGCAVPAFLSDMTRFGAFVADSTILSFLVSHRGAVVAIAGAALALAGMVQWRWLASPCPVAPPEAAIACRIGRARTLAAIGLSALIYMAAFLIAYLPAAIAIAG